MTVHNKHPKPDEREEFLVDGCPRCKEYVDDLGVHFDPERFQAFWAKMIEVEWDNAGSYASQFDKELGTKLYYVSLALQRSFNLHPGFFQTIRSVAEFRARYYPEPDPEIKI